MEEKENINLNVNEEEEKRIVTAIPRQKKRSKKRVFLLLLLLVATGTMLATSTYAWFTANEAVRVDRITVNVEAQGGIQLSADGTNWKQILLTTDITGVHGTTYTSSVNQLPAALEPVSTGLNVTANGRLEMFYGTVTTNEGGDFILTAAASVETESNGATSDGKFVAFDLFFKSDTATNLYMTPDSNVTTSDVADKGIKNAARVAYVVLGNTASTSSVATIQALGTTDAASSPVYMWEPNYDVHSATGIINARDYYELTVAATDEARIAYDGVIAPITAANNVLLGNAKAASFATLFKTVNSTYTTAETLGTDDYTQVFSLLEGVTKVRVYMWVEGQDIDCENGASGGNINFDLAFTITEP